MTRARKTRLRRAANGRGFTLIELLVAMVAGLVVSLAIVGISRETTNTFHEEMRSGSAEMSLRTAIDRLKNDVQRAGYMSTGNINTDIRIPLDPKGQRIANSTPQLVALAGIRFDRNGGRAGTAAVTPLSTAGDNAFSPDAIELSGNYTSSDVFVVTRVTTGNCGGPRLIFSMDSAATYRVLATADPGKTLEAMFQPVAGGKFMVRVADDLGRHEIVYGCPAATAGYTAGVGAWVDLEQPMPYLETAYGFIDGRITVNPVQMIRYEIRPLASTDTTYGALNTDPGQDGGVSTKYNLIRSWIAPNMEPMAGGAEVIAEFAVDLKFAFTADLTDYRNNATTANVVSYPFGSALNDIANGNGAGTQPERVRSVRLRLSTRASVPDRSDDFRVPNMGGVAAGYTMRYCLDPAGCTSGARSWARVRTITTEVSLPNQARNFF